MTGGNDLFNNIGDMFGGGSQPMQNTQPDNLMGGGMMNQPAAPLGGGLDDIFGTGPS